MIKDLKERKDDIERPLLFKYYSKYNYSWKIWYSYHKKNQNNKDSFSSVLNEIVTFDSVENFWR